MGKIRTKKFKFSDIKLYELFDQEEKERKKDLFFTFDFNIIIEQEYFIKVDKTNRKYEIFKNGKKFANEYSIYNCVEDIKFDIDKQDYTVYAWN